MKEENLPRLRFFAYLFLLPGLVGLIISTMISTSYLNTLPRFPDPESLRVIPRNINGYIVYQTEAENNRLNLIEYSSVGVFLIGLVTGLAYQQKWAVARAVDAEDEEFLSGKS